MKNHLVTALIALAVILTIAGVVSATEPNVFNIQEATFNLGSAVKGAALGAASFIDSATSFTDVDITNDLRVQQESELQATTTIQEITYGSRFAKALSFAAAATTTPGGLVSLQNTGADRICSNLEVDINTVARGNTSLVFAFGTSTAASAWTGTTGGSLIATTTLPTSTTAILSPQYDFGHFWSATPTVRGFATSTGPWLWKNGEYINGLFDADGAPDTASSTDYSNMTGKLYVNCHTR